ncbi:hypothetical protein [Halobaculum sp. MBLA0143]|uniref:hypothetical protein n=1 Tax=Halobaculum sp. MBLA0143 TaxID=3079933 RepID=UPI00352614DA
MTVDELDADIDDAAAALGEETTVELDRETRSELATLAAVTDADADELLRRAVHTLFRQSVDTGDLDFQLRRAYDLTYDEYLAGVTYDEMTNDPGGQPPADDRENGRPYRQ